MSTGNHMIDGDDGSHSSSPSCKELPQCPSCNGNGQTLDSCCGIDIYDNIGESDICPQCYEHCGDEPETCTRCDGKGVITVEEHREYYLD